jgi:hypothetical protein
MKNNRNWIRLAAMSIAIALTMSVLGGIGAVKPQAPTTSAANSQPSATPVYSAKDDEALRRSCMDALGELKAARKLLESQGALIERQEEMLKLERQISEGLKNLRTLDADEKQELRAALAAKDRVIAALEAANAELKKNKFTLWKKIKYGAVMAAVGVLIGKVL